MAEITFCTYAAVWQQSKVRERGLALRHRLNDGPVCDAQRAVAAYAACGAI